MNTKLAHWLLHILYKGLCTGLNSGVFIVPSSNLLRATDFVLSLLLEEGYKESLQGVEDKLGAMEFFGLDFRKLDKWYEWDIISYRVYYVRFFCHFLIQTKILCLHTWNIILATMLYSLAFSVSSLLGFLKAT